MAEYKNGVNFRGNMSVEKNDVNPDVQTGRAIFVDEDKYEKDSVYKAKVDKCLAEGFHKVGESGGGGSSDFSTASVTVTNSTPAMEWIGVINPIDEADFHALDTDFKIIQGTNEFQCVLYKGLGWIDMVTLSQQGLTITVSGDATYSGEGHIAVTGDCTITIS